MMQLRLPANVSRFRDRHGKWRYRFRRKGYPTVYLKGEPGTPEFLREVAAVEPEGQHHQYGSLDWLIADYYKSERWLGIGADSTKRVYRRLIERFRADHGHRMVADATPRALDAALAKYRETPTVANRIRKLLIAIFEHAIKLDMRTTNPAKMADSYKVKVKGFHAWTDKEIAAFEKQWPVGTSARLAFALLLYTGQRRSDIVKARPNDIEDGWIFFQQRKTDKPLSLPIHPELAEALEAGPIGIHTIIEGERGSFTSNSFGNWFKKRCKAAGVGHCSAHGLRKAMARRLAEKGASNAGIKAVGGWSQDKEVALYTKSVDQRRLAEAMLKKLLESD